MTKEKIAVFVGSLRKESFNRKMAKALMALAPESLKLEIVEIGGLPLYDQGLDDERRPPSAWTVFREPVKSFDGFLFVTPEYNRSVPGVLKNAIDVGSRPYGQSVWGGKPGAVMSVSPGVIQALKNAPYPVKEEIELKNGDDKSIPIKDKPCALHRCGSPATSHSVIGLI